MEHTGRSEISVLFVDTEKLIRDSFARELRAEGFSVTAVANKREAINEIERKVYDLIVTDLMIPDDIDGFSVLEAAKRNDRQTSVIIFSSYSNMQSINDALQLGADDFTLKPCEVEELVFRIHRCTERQQLLKLLASRNRNSHIRKLPDTADPTGIPPKSQLKFNPD